MRLNPGDTRTIKTVDNAAPDIIRPLLGKKAVVVGESRSHKNHYVVDVEGQVYDIEARFLLIDDWDRLHKLIEWWNSQIDRINSHIDDNQHRNHTYFHWDQLIHQELRMWATLGKPVTPSDLDFMVNRRGFSDVQRDFLIEGLEVMGLWYPDGVPSSEETQKFWDGAFEDNEMAALRKALPEEEA